MSFAHTRHVAHTEKKRPAKNLLPSTKEGREHLSHLIKGKRCKRAALMLEEQQLSSRLQHPCCSSESTQGLWEDTQTECVHHGVRGPIIIRQGCHIACIDKIGNQSRLSCLPKTSRPITLSLQASRAEIA